MTRLSTVLLIAAISISAPLSAHDRYRIIGTVTKITADEITVKQAKDNTLVEMDHDKKTKVTRDGKAAKITDVKAGSTVVIDALGDSILDLLVLEIRLVPPIPVTKKPSTSHSPGVLQFDQQLIRIKLPAVKQRTDVVVVDDE